ncbi:MAG: hypothetical protein HKN91_09800 [Acidimicrobiia bacterium]|nr:hypothetical protein [Acidimicrobiia bacterium]
MPDSQDSNYDGISDASADELSGHGRSRRELLKRAAAVGAAAWTVPVVATFNTPAFAGNDVSPIRCEAWSCGDPLVECGAGCFCDVDVEGNPFCSQVIACVSSPPCETSADCPPGWRCTSNCCSTTTAPFTCVPPCGDGPLLARDGRVKTTAG